MTRLFNHNKTWEASMLKELKDLFSQERSLREIASTMGRTGTSIICKLKSLGLILPQTGSGSNTRYVRQDGTTFAFEAHVDDVNRFMDTPITEQKQEKEMTTNNVRVDPSVALCVVTVDSSNSQIEKKTYIFGVESSSVSDDKIYDHIARMEIEVAKLEGILCKPEKLKKKINTMKEEIAKLAAFVDQR